MNDETPTISVVIPGYEQARFIEPCLDSVAAQTWDGRVEVIVVDDGSPDDLGNRARNHRLDPTVIHQPNRGVAAARNRGIAESSAPWIAFLDADDRWLPTKLADQMRALTRLGRPALSFCRYRRVDEDGNALDVEPDHPAPHLEPTARHLIIQNFIGTSTTLVHRHCLERCGGFPETTNLEHGGQDYALWLRIAAYFPLVYIAELGVEYTVHAGNRVGVDPVRHHRAGLEALADFYRWDSPRFTGLVHGDFASVALRRLAKFVADTPGRLQTNRISSLVRLMCQTRAATRGNV